MARCSTTRQGRRGRPRRDLGRPPETPPGQERAIYRAVIVLAALSLLLSLYLTYLYFSGTRTAFCPEGSGCDIVQASPYSRLLGIPVALLGVVGYAAILVIALSPLPSQTKRLSLYSLAVGGFAFAAYLTYRELFTIEAICPYCVALALLTTAILIALLLQRPIVPGLSSGSVTALTAFIVAVVLLGSATLPTTFAQEEAAATDFREGLAKHLTATGAVMYGAWWCPHCNEQKELFGDAFKYVNYVECDPRGENPKPWLCREKGIRGFPTWEIGGRMYEGLLPLEQLARLSGYRRASSSP